VKGARTLRRPKRKWVDNINTDPEYNMKCGPCYSG